MKKDIIIFYLHEEFVSKFLEREFGRGAWPKGSVNIIANVDGDTEEISSIKGLNSGSFYADRTIVEKELIKETTTEILSSLKAKCSDSFETYSLREL